MSLNYLFRIKQVGTKKKLLHRCGNTYKHRRWQLFRVNWKAFIPNFCSLSLPPCLPLPARGITPAGFISMIWLRHCITKLESPFLLCYLSPSLSFPSFLQPFFPFHCIFLFFLLSVFIYLSASVLYQALKQLSHTERLETHCLNQSGVQSPVGRQIYKSLTTRAMQCQKC